MSDIAKQRDIARRLEQTQVVERPALYLPWTQRVLNPFPLASSGGVWGDMAQPWPATILAFNCSVFVDATNNATNFWTIRLIDQLGNTLASFTTAAIAAGTWTRFSVSSGIVQPATTNTVLPIIATAALSPGPIFIVPSIALLRN